MGEKTQEHSKMCQYFRHSERENSVKVLLAPTG